MIGERLDVLPECITTLPQKKKKYKYIHATINNVGD